MKDDLLGEVMLLRLNVIPAYAEDDDEGSRSEEDYASFYATHLDEAIEAATEYWNRFRRLLESPDSEGEFAKYLDARRRFAASLPFCCDDMPDESDDGFWENRNWFKAQREHQHAYLPRHLDSLERFQKLLVELKRISE